MTATAAAGASGHGLTVVETGYIVGDTSSTSISVYALVKQDGSGPGVQAALNWTVKSTSGQLLGTAEGLVNTNGTGDVQWTEESLSVPNAAAVGEVTSTLGFTRFSLDVAIGKAIVDEVTYVGGSYTYKATGYVTSTYADPKVYISTVCKDPAGKAVATGVTVVSTLSGERTPWSITLQPGSYKITVAQCFTSAHG